MRCWSALVPLAFACCGLPALAGNPALLRESGIVSAQTLSGDFPVRLTPIVPARDVTLVLLSDTLQPGDIVCVRRDLVATFTHAFLSAHPLRIVALGEGDGIGPRLGSPTELQTAVNRIALHESHGSSISDLFAGLGGAASSLPTNWGSAIVIGRLPSPASDEAWIAAWLAEAYRAHRVRASFWSLDGSAPAWAQSLSAATAGVVATTGLNALLPMLRDTTSVYFEASWDSELQRGAWPYIAGLRDSRGQFVTFIPGLASAAGFTVPLQPYLAARANMRVYPDSGPAARAVLDQNPSDLDALRRLAQICARQHKAKESAALWRQITGVSPRDGAAWAEFGEESYAAASYKDAERALLRAASLGVKNRATLATDAQLHILRKDFQGALPLLDQALADDKAAQALWLLRADCAHSLTRWPQEAESLERAIAVGPVPLERSTQLIDGYFRAGDPQHALAHLRAVTPRLPRDAAVRTEYASFWDQLHNTSAAEALWKSALEIDGKFAPAYIGLAKQYLNNGRPADALKLTDKGLAAAPGTVELVLTKEAALERLGKIYAARHLLSALTPDTQQIELLKRRARLEDCYGSDGGEAYLALVNALIKSDASRDDIVESCRRGLRVALRTERLDLARIFAEKLATAGDHSGLDLVQPGAARAQSRTEIPGGADAFRFLVLGKVKGKSDGIFADYSRALSALAADSYSPINKAGWQAMSETVHAYFQQVSALTALGTRKQNHFEILLSLNNKTDKQRTERVFGILGLKLKKNKSGLTLESAEGKSQAKKQDMLAALDIDDQAIRDALAAGKPYALNITIDSVPVFPAADVWERAFYEHTRFPGGLAEAFVTDPRIPQLYIGLNSMDRAAARALLQAVSLRALAERFCRPLSLFSAAMAMNGSGAEVPGGSNASAVWRQLAGADPANGVRFFQALLSRDDGRLIAFFYTLSELDVAHQQFFTRSPERTKRFYDLFRESVAGRNGLRFNSNSFVEFLRGVPLNKDGTVNFPGAPEVWMVAKGRNASGGAMAKMARKLKRTAAPDDEDAILIRLASTGYKGQEHHDSELENFIAVSRIDAQREKPMDPESALLLAQGYGSFRGLYPYFSELGDLNAADYQKAFSLEAKLSGTDTVAINTRLGELHSFLAMLALLRENCVAPPNRILQLYRTGLDGFTNANDGAGWTTASLTAIDDIARLALPEIHSRDAAVRSLLLGNAGGREQAYRKVLALQKVPSFDSLFEIWVSLRSLGSDPSAPDRIQRQLSALEVLAPAKSWRLTGDRKRNLERYRTVEAQALALRLREKFNKRKRNQTEIERLSGQLIAELEPWTELAMAGQIYARFLDPADLVVSQDPMLLRKHEFISLQPSALKRQLFTAASLSVSNEGEGSYFTGGLAEFSLAAGRARAQSSHLGGQSGAAFVAAMLAGIRGTDWAALTSSELQSFGGTVRLAREWIVESATSAPMDRELERDTRGLLSLSRRKVLLNGIDRRDWPDVWEALSISDLHFLGETLLERAPKEFWNSAVLNTMREAAGHAKGLDLLGSVAPELDGCPQPRLLRYEPYEEYQFQVRPERLAQRVSELKLYLAWLADGSAWSPDVLAGVASPAADIVLSRLAMRDMWDWKGALDSYRSLKAADLEPLLSRR